MTTTQEAEVPQQRKSKATPVRAVRIDDELWNAALAATADNDDTISGVMRKALENYVKRKGAK